MPKFSVLFSGTDLCSQLQPVRWLSRWGRGNRAEGEASVRTGACSLGLCSLGLCSTGLCSMGPCSTGVCIALCSRGQLKDPEQTLPSGWVLARVNFLVLTKHPDSRVISCRWGDGWRAPQELSILCLKFILKRKICSTFYTKERQGHDLKSNVYSVYLYILNIYWLLQKCFVFHMTRSPVTSERVLC